MLSLKPKTQDMAYLTGRELGYPVSHLTGFFSIFAVEIGLVEFL